MGRKKENAAREAICVNLQVLILFNMADHLMNVHCRKKGPALYDHYLPGADCADTAQATDFNIETHVSIPKIVDPPCLNDLVRGKCSAFTDRVIMYRVCLLDPESFYCVFSARGPMIPASKIATPHETHDAIILDVVAH